MTRTAYHVPGSQLENIEKEHLILLITKYDRQNLAAQATSVPLNNMKSARKQLKERVVALNPLSGDNSP